MLLIRLRVAGGQVVLLQVLTLQLLAQLLHLVLPRLLLETGRALHHLRPQLLPLLLMRTRRLQSQGQE